MKCAYIRITAMARKREHIVEEGQRFGRLAVIDPDVRMEAPKVRGGYRRAAICRCDCGTVTKPISIYALINGNQRSCGCLRREMQATRNAGVPYLVAYARSEENRRRLSEHPLGRTHGLSKHPLYSTWANMLGRCYSEAHTNYAGYGGRGIQVYEAWHDVAVFLAWVEENLGQRPAGCTLDRKDNDGNYEPGNVRWADDLTQRRNIRRVNVLQEKIASLQRELEQLRGGDAK